jgi:hypothetical protein
VKQGVTKENVFKMIEAIGDHSLDVYNYCLHFIGEFVVWEILYTNVVC